MILTIFVIITGIEAIVLSVKIKKILEYRDCSKEVGMHLSFHNKITNFDRFLIRLYNNYHDIIWVFVVVILLANLIASTLIYAIISAFQFVLITL